MKTYSKKELIKILKTEREKYEKQRNSLDAEEADFYKITYLHKNQ